MRKYFSKYKDIPKYVTKLARQMRVNSTVQEQKLWQQLSGKRLQGLKFRRQFPIDRYIVDFYYHPCRLIIEIDGSVHNHTKEFDQNRERYLKARGYQIIRFSNQQVDMAIEQVVQTIVNTIKHPPAGESGGEAKSSSQTIISYDISQKGQTQ